MESQHQELINSLLGNASQQILKEVNGALYFLPGQYLFCWKENQEDRFKLVSPDAIKAAFNQEPIDSGWMPTHIIRSGINSQGAWIVQFIPATKHILQIKTEILTVPLPPLVFLGTETNYFLWAIKEKTFSPEAMGYHAPLPNIYETGKLCFGTNSAPVAAMDTIEIAKTMFFSAEFNDDLADGKSKHKPTNINPHLKSIINRRSYPMKDLEPVRKTIEQIIREKIHAR